MAYYQIRTSDGEAGELLQRLAEEDMRSIGQEVAWLIRMEYARRQGPVIVNTNNTQPVSQEPAPCGS